MEELKRQGNLQFKLRNYEEAIEKYLKALNVCDETEKYLLFSNISAAFIMVEDFDQSLLYARRCVQNNPLFEKGHIRLLSSLIHSGKLDEASHYLEKIGLEGSKHETLQRMKNKFLEDIENARFPNRLYRMKTVGPVRYHRLHARIEPKTGPNFFSFNNTLYHIGGGENNGADIFELWRFETGSRVWRTVETTGDRPYGRFLHRSIFSKSEKKLFLFGGFPFSVFDDMKMNIYELDLLTNVWRTLPYKNQNFQLEKRGGFHFGKIGDVFYAFGGYSPTKEVDRIFIKYDRKDCKWSKIPLHVAQIDNTGKESSPVDIKRIPNFKTNFSFCPANYSLFQKNKRNNRNVAFLFAELPILPDSSNVLEKESTLEVLFCLDLDKGILKYRKINGIPHHLRSKKNDNSREGEDQRTELRRIATGLDESPFPMCRHFVTGEEYILLCLYKDRYVLEFDSENMRWNERVLLSGTGIIDEAMRSNESVNSKRMKEMKLCGDLLFLFPGRISNFWSEKLVVVRLEKRRERECRENLGKCEEFSDITIKCET